MTNDEAMISRETGDNMLNDDTQNNNVSVDIKLQEKTSETLHRILKHWIKLFIKGECGSIELPFNLEDFCRENDEMIQKLEKQNQIMREALTPFSNALKWCKDEDLLKGHEWYPPFYGIDFVKARQALAELDKGE